MTTQSTQRSAGKRARPKPTALKVNIDEDQIREVAQKISQDQKSYDDWIWLLAESECRLGPACTSPSNKFRTGGLPSEVEIYPSKVVVQPPEDDIRQLAYDISQVRPSVEDIHWFMAQRQIVFDVSQNQGM
jgi:hypothetical protein